MSMWKRCVFSFKFPSNWVADLNDLEWPELETFYIKWLACSHYIECPIIYQSLSILKPSVIHYVSSPSYLTAMSALQVQPCQNKTKYVHLSSFTASVVFLIFPPLSFFIILSPPFSPFAIPDLYHFSASSIIIKTLSETVFVLNIQYEVMSIHSAQGFVCNDRPISARMTSPQLSKEMPEKFPNQPHSSTTCDLSDP